MDALDSVDELETDLDQSKESMYKLSYVIRVCAPDLDELKRRCDEVKDFYDDLNVKLVRPAGAVSYTHLDVYKRQFMSLGNVEIVIIILSICIFSLILEIALKVI